MERIEWRLKPSKIAAYLFTSLYLGGAIALWLSPMNVVFCCLFTLVLISELRQVLDQQAWRCSPQAIIAFWQTESAVWFCQTRSGQQFRVTLKRHSFCSPSFCLLRFSHATRHWAVCLPFDALHPVSYRRLLRHLKMPGRRRTTQPSSL